MWTTSMASLRPSRSGRRTPRGIRAPPSRPPPSATIFCACCSRAWARRFARTAARACARTRWTKWRRGCSTQPEGSRWYALFPCGEHATTRGLARSSVRTAQEGLQPAVPGRRGCSNSPRRNRCWISISRKPRVRAGGPHRDRAGPAPAPGGYGRNLLPRGGRGDLRERVRRRARCASTRSFQCKTCGMEFVTPEPILFSFNSPVGRVPALPGLRQHDRFRHGPRDSRTRRSRSTRARWIRGPSRSTAPGWATSRSTRRARCASNVPCLRSDRRRSARRWTSSSAASSITWRARSTSCTCACF